MFFIEIVDCSPLSLEKSHVDRCTVPKRSMPTDRKQARFADAGGMYLQVSPAGSKRWFLKYRVGGKEKRLALGSYPDVSLTAARKARDTAKLQKSERIDPLQARQVEKLKALRGADDTFKTIAMEWYAKQVSQWSAEHAKRMLRQLERDLFPWIGSKPMQKIEPMEVLAALQKIEERGALETADRGLMLVRQVFDYWLPMANVQQRNIDPVVGKAT